MPKNAQTFLSMLVIDDDEELFEHFEAIEGDSFNSLSKLKVVFIANKFPHTIF